MRGRMRDDHDPAADSRLLDRRADQVAQLITRQGRIAHQRVRRDEPADTDLGEGERLIAQGDHGDCALDERAALLRVGHHIRRHTGL